MNCFDMITKQSAEIQRLRFALHGCLIASKESSPLYYNSALANIQSEANNALYGDILEMDVVDRPVATEAK